MKLSPRRYNGISVKYGVKADTPIRRTMVLGMDKILVKIFSLTVKRTTASVLANTYTG